MHVQQLSFEYDNPVVHQISTTEKKNKTTSFDLITQTVENWFLYWYNGIKSYTGS